MKIGTLLSIVRQSGIPRKEFENNGTEVHTVNEPLLQKVRL